MDRSKREILAHVLGLDINHVQVVSIVTTSKDYVVLSGTGEVTGDGTHDGCFVYEQSEVERWLGASRAEAKHADFCAQLEPVEDAGVARVVRDELGLAANAAGLCRPVKADYRYKGYVIAMGTHRDTRHDRIDRWYIDDEADRWDRRGKGYRTFREAKAAIDDGQV